MTNDTTPPEWHPVERASVALDEMCRDLINRAYKVEPFPLVGSDFAEDAAIDYDLAVSLTACARDFAVSAMDNAQGTARSVKPEPLFHAGYACARAALSACGMLNWVLAVGDNPDTLTRFSRILELYCQDARNDDKASTNEDSAPALTQEGAKGPYLDRINAAIDIATPLGIEYSRKTQHALPHFSKLPREGDGASKFAEGSGQDYRLYSRVLHGKARALAVSTLATPNVMVPGQRSYNPDVALTLVHKLAGWVSKAAWIWFNHVGWDTNEMETTLEGHLKELEWREGEWPWADLTTR